MAGTCDSLEKPSPVGDVSRRRRASRSGRTGQVDLGPDEKLDALAAAMRATEVPFDELDATGVRVGCPRWRCESGERALFHAEAARCSPMRRCGAEADAVEAGAELSMPERCIAIEVGARRRDSGDRRRTVRAERVVVAAGPWSGELLRSAGIELPLAPAVAQVTFLEAPALVERPGIADWLIDGGVGVYGHPVPGIGYKVAFDAVRPNPGSRMSRRGLPTWPSRID